MSTTVHPPEAADALVDYIESSCRERCDGLRREAEAAALALLRETRARANRSVRQAVRLERSRVARRLREAGSRVTLERRARIQSALADAVTALLPEVEAALEALWLEPDSQRIWIERTLALADHRLPVREWRVRVPPDLDPARLTWPDGVEACLGTDPGLSAGLIVEAGAARLDSTPAGLLARDDWIRGKLLGLMQQGGTVR